MPDVFELPLFNLPRSHRFGRLFAFERLNAGHLITTDRMLTLRLTRGGRLVDFTHRFYLLLKHCRVGFRRVQPIPAAMWL